MTSERFASLPLYEQAELCGITIESEAAMEWFKNLPQRERASLRLTKLDKGKMRLAMDLGIKIE